MDGLFQNRRGGLEPAQAPLCGSHLGLARQVFAKSPCYECRLLSLQRPRRHQSAGVFPRRGRVRSGRPGARRLHPIQGGRLHARILAGAPPGLANGGLHGLFQDREHGARPGRRPRQRSLAGAPVSDRTGRQLGGGCNARRDHARRRADRFGRQDGDGNSRPDHSLQRPRASACARCVTSRSTCRTGVSPGSQAPPNICKPCRRAERW